MAIKVWLETSAIEQGVFLKKGIRLTKTFCLFE